MVCFQFLERVVMAVYLSGGHIDPILTAECGKDGLGTIATGSDTGELCLWNVNGTLTGNRNDNALHHI